MKNHRAANCAILFPNTSYFTAPPSHAALTLTTSTRANIGVASDGFCYFTIHFLAVTHLLLNILYIQFIPLISYVAEPRESEDKPCKPSIFRDISDISYIYIYRIYSIHHWVIAFLVTPSRRRLLQQPSPAIRLLEASTSHMVQHLEGNPDPQLD